MRRCTIAAAEHLPLPREPRARRSSTGTGLASSSAEVRGRLIFILFGLAIEARLAGAVPSILVRAGDPSPLGLPFSRFSDPAVDDRGQVTFIGGSTVIFRRTGGNIVHLAGAGDVLQGHRVAGVGPPALGADCLGFRVGFVGGGAGVFRQCSGTLVSVAEIGFPAPGGGHFVGLGESVAVGTGGRTAFSAVLEDGTSGLFLAESDGTLREVVRSGTTAPTGGTFSGLRLVGVSAAGRVGFRGATSGGPDGFFYWDGAVIRRLVVVGDATPAGGIFTSLGQAAMNDAETWIFRGVVSAGSRNGLFRTSSTSPLAIVTTVALAGDPSPIGGTYKEFPSSLVPAINASEVIAFRATVDGASFPSGIFLALPDGRQVKVAAVGEPTAAGQLVRLREVGLADDGGAVFRATLIGGAPGLFVARGGRVDTLAVLGDPTDLGGGFRFSNASPRSTGEDAVFMGTREAVFVLAAGALGTVATLGDPTPLGGQYAGFDQPAAGGRKTVFGATIQQGRVGEALLAVGRGRAVVVAKSGDRVGKVTKVVDFFSSPLDDLARPSVAGGSVVFQTSLAGAGSGTGIVAWSGGNLRMAARSGGHAPAGGSYTAFGTPAAAAGGRVAFVAQQSERKWGLFAAAGHGTRLLAGSDGDTGTWLNGFFVNFDTPAASGSSVAFRATLDHAREGVFVVRGRCTTALAGSGEADPGGGKFRGFADLTFAGHSVVFRGTVIGGGTSAGLYQSTPDAGCAQAPPPLTPLAVAGDGSSAGTFLGFGAPAGNRRGGVAFAVDVSGAGATDAIALVE